MRIFVMVGLSLMAATGVAAQDRQELSPANTPASTSTALTSSATTGTETLRSALTSLPLPATLFASTAQQTPPIPPPATRPTAARRRGSMVGYIDDATVESKVRVRFDAASENTVPDRAEFFYAKCGCYRGLDPSNPAHDPDAPGPGPGAANDVDFKQLDIFGEYAFNKLFSAYVQFPLRWLQPQSFIAGTGAPFTDESGFGDMRAGVKVGFSPAANHMLTARAQFFFPTGDASKGLGTNHSTVEPGVLYNWQASDAVTVESQLAVWLPFGGSAGVPTSVDDHFSGRVLTWGVGSGVNVYRGRDIEVGPVVELVGWRVMSGFQTAATSDASGTNIVNLKIGGRVTLNATHSVYVGWGKALTDATWYSDIWRFEYRFAF